MSLETARHLIAILATTLFVIGIVTSIFQILNEQKVSPSVVLAWQISGLAWMIIGVIS